jgi:hypothetical protein
MEGTEYLVSWEKYGPRDEKGRLCWNQIEDLGEPEFRQLEPDAGLARSVKRS